MEFIDLGSNLHKFKDGFGYLIEETAHGAVVLAGFLSFYCLVKIGIKLLSGERFPWLEIFRPLVIFVLVANWGGVVRMMDDIGYYVEDNIMTSVKDTGKAAWDSVVQSLKCEAAQGAIVDGKPADDKNATEPDKPAFGMGLKKVLNVALNFFITAVQSGWTVFLKFLSVITGAIMQVMGYVYLVLLGILGSWALAFGIIPELNTIKTWFASYLQYFLWGPLCCIVNRMCSGNLFSNISTMVSSDLANPFYHFLFNTALNIATIFVLFSIPKISRVIISAGEDIAGAALSQFVAKTVGDVVSKTADAAMKAGTGV